MGKDINFLFELTKLNRILTNKIQREFNASGQAITFADFAVLHLIEERKSVKSLIEMTGKDKGRMTKHLKDLAHMELIYILPLSNHKNLEAIITPNGKKAVKNATYLLNKIRKNEFKMISKSDTENIAKLYQKVVKLDL